MILDVTVWKESLLA